MPQTKRLGLDTRYVKPEKTFQQTLTKEQIDEYLLGYKQVNNIAEVPLNTMLRYYSVYTDKKTGNQRKNFRIGGKLINKDYPSKYVVLSNGQKSWSVQSGSSIFYYKQPTNEVIKEHRQETSNLKKEFTKQIEMSEQNIQYVNKQSEKDLLYLNNLHQEELSKYKEKLKILQNEIRHKDALINKLSNKLKEKMKS